jgi:hypothetical protein
MDNPISGTSSDIAVAAVKGENAAGGDGVVGSSTVGGGVGVRGKSTNNAGVFGESDGAHGVIGFAHFHLAGGVLGGNDKGGFGVMGSATSSGTGVYGESDTGVGVRGKGGKLAGLFEGDVEVTGALTVSGKNVDTRLADLESRLESRIDAGFADLLRGRMWELEKIQYLVLYLNDQVFDLLRPAVADLVARSGLPPFPPIPPYDFPMVDPLERHHG